jgi:hypothetical protein
MPKRGEVTFNQESGLTTLVYTLISKQPAILEYYSPVTLQFYQFPCVMGEGEQATEARFLEKNCSDTCTAIYVPKKDFMRRKERALRLKGEKK